jgi:hypothetical protein
MRLRLTSALILLFPSVLAADGGGSLVVGAPRGALGEQASVAGGLAGHAVFPSGASALSLRLEGSWLLYGSETVRLPVARTAGRLNREITTDNWIAELGLGPQLVLGKRGVRPYVHGFAGVAYLSTTSQLRDPDRFVSATSTNYDDTTFSYGGGGGLLVPLHGRDTSLDLGVRYVRTGSVRFLGEGDLVSTDGGVSAMPHRGHADVLEFRLGLAFGQRPR